MTCYLADTHKVKTTKTTNCWKKMKCFLIELFIANTSAIWDGSSDVMEVR